VSGQFKTKKHMKLSQALKLKNRLAGDLSRQQQIAQRENSRRNDNQSSIDLVQVWAKIEDLTTQLSEIKTKIAKANIGIYAEIDRMAELKSRIAFLNGLPKREGAEPMMFGDTNINYIWTSYINQEKCDEFVEDLQIQINNLQDKIDTYNATTDIE
jgi:DNA repair ATPase RecN